MCWAQLFASQDQYPVQVFIQILLTCRTYRGHTTCAHFISYDRVLERRRRKTARKPRFELDHYDGAIIIDCRLSLFCRHVQFHAQSEPAAVTTKQVVPSPDTDFGVGLLSEVEPQLKLLAYLFSKNTAAPLDVLVLALLPTKVQFISTIRL